MTIPAHTSIALGHEPDRVAVAGIVASVASLVLLIAAVGVTIKLALADTHPALPAAASIPDQPARHDWGDAGREQLRRLREREAANLSSSQWLDEAHTKRRIPIEDAMRLLAEREAAGGKGPAR